MTYKGTRPDANNQKNCLWSLLKMYMKAQVPQLHIFKENVAFKFRNMYLQDGT